jgi:hypothetical protein
MIFFPVRRDVFLVFDLRRTFTISLVIEISCKNKGTSLRLMYSESKLFKLLIKSVDLTQVTKWDHCIINFI